MVDRQAFVLTPAELARLNHLVGPHRETIGQLEHDLAAARAELRNMLSAYLVGKSLDGEWNINFVSGLIQPLPLLSNNGAEGPLPTTDILPSEGEESVSHQ